MHKILSVIAVSMISITIYYIDINLKISINNSVQFSDF